LRADRPAFVVNLTVHGIGAEPRDIGPGEAAVWVSVEQFEQVLDAISARPDVRLTFDDANMSDVDIALPLLVRRGLIADFFILAGLLGEPGRLDRSGVRELARAGMRIGSHGWAHRDWRRLAGGELTEELTDAPRVLGELTGGTVAAVSVPFGSYDRHVLRRLRHVGADRVYTSDGGRARPGSWLQARTSLRRELDAGWVRGVLDGKAPLKQRARRVAVRMVKRMRG
jgi:peptidoglycan/xylan/chitin deacetylase (PgdA/CDA1 family)